MGGGESDEEQSEDSEEENAMDTGKDQSNNSNKPPMLPPPPSPEQRDFPLYLTNHQKGSLYIPAEMSKKDYDLLKQQIDNHLAIILLTSVVPDDERREQ